MFFHASLWKSLSGLFGQTNTLSRASLLVQMVKHLPATWEIWVGTIPWRRAWLLTPVFLPGESHGQRSLAGYSPLGRTGLEVERLTPRLALYPRTELIKSKSGLEGRILTRSKILGLFHSITLHGQFSMGYQICLLFHSGLPFWLSWQRICLQCGRPGFNSWVGKIP